MKNYYETLEMMMVWGFLFEPVDYTEAAFFSMNCIFAVDDFFSRGIFEEELCQVKTK